MNQKQASVKYGVYIFVWLGLVGLTWLTITIAGLRAGKASILLPLVIATIKASMVFSYFMHLRYEKGLFKALIPIAIALLIVFFWLVFSDVAYR